MLRQGYIIVDRAETWNLTVCSTSRIKDGRLRKETRRTLPSSMEARAVTRPLGVSNRIVVVGPETGNNPCSSMTVVSR